MKLIRSSVKIFMFLIILAISFRPSMAMAQFFFMESPLVGKQAIDFTLNTISGTEQSMSQFRAGKKAIIFFWATWCPHCREQLTYLTEKKADIEQKGIKILLVDIGETKEEVSAHIKRFKVNYEVFLDADNAVAEKYSLIGVPTFFFVNEKGIVKAVKHALPDDLNKIF